METIGVILLSADSLSGAGLSMMLAQNEQLDVVAQIVGGLEDIDDEELESADCLLWDLGWELEDLPADLLPIPTVALTAEADVGLLIQLGVMGILSRTADSDTIGAALSAVVNGLIVIDDSFRDTLNTPAQKIQEEPLESLTPREQDVLELVAEGLANRAIAQALDISTHTVKFHLNAVMTKLNAQSRTEAVVIATRHGLLSL